MLLTSILNELQLLQIRISKKSLWTFQSWSFHRKTFHYSCRQIWFYKVLIQGSWVQLNTTVFNSYKKCLNHLSLSFRFTIILYFALIYDVESQLNKLGVCDWTVTKCEKKLRGCEYFCQGAINTHMSTHAHPHRKCTQRSFLSHNRFEV